MIIFGSRANRIGSVQLPGTHCDYCHTQQAQEITQFGQYFHIFWIPFFPIGRKTFAECTHCKRTIGKREFTPELRNALNDHKSSIKRPVWHWAGLILVAFLVLFFYALPLL